MKDQSAIDARAALVAHWLAANPGAYRAAEIGGHTRINGDQIGPALWCAQRKGLVRSERTARGFLHWRALPKAAEVVLPVAEPAPARLVMTGRIQRGVKVAVWLEHNPGWHPIRDLAREFLFTRFDLLDALEAAEELGLVQSRPGERGHRDWAAMDAAVSNPEGESEE